MIKTELFVAIGNLASVYEYQKFIEENQDIKIISVNVLDHDDILLTYEKNV